MHLSVLTLFPEFFDSPLRCGLMARARESGLLDFRFINPRDFALDRHRCVDDRPYGGGPGMVMLLAPLLAALESLPARGRTLLLAPGGRPFSQTMARELATEPELTLICRRYEGIDARLSAFAPIEPVCVGDFVLNGGETAALSVIEAVARLLPGFMGHEHSGDEESFSAGLLEHPHYTRPEDFQGRRVPEILLSGDHGRIATWRREQSLLATLRTRPELLANAPLDEHDIRALRRLLAAAATPRPGKNLYLALIHYPVYNRQGKIGSVSLTNLDLHDIARCSCAYDLGGFFVVTPLRDQQELARELIGHWVGGPGGRTNPDREQALAGIDVVTDWEAAAAAVEVRTGRHPRVLATSARAGGGVFPRQVRDWLEQGPVLLLFGTGSGLARDVTERIDGQLRPLRPFDAYNHLSVRAATAITLDRILGDI